MSKLRPEAHHVATNKYCPTGGSAYLIAYNAVKSKSALIHGKLHLHGESCAIGSVWDVNPNIALKADFIDEIAAVNDSIPNASAKARRNHVLRWLQWKLATIGMPGFKVKK